jgi:hypothetical protein
VLPRREPREQVEGYSKLATCTPHKPTSLSGVISMNSIAVVDLHYYPIGARQSRSEAGVRTAAAMPRQKNHTNHPLRSKLRN